MKGRWKPLWYSTCIDKSLLIIIGNGARDGAQMEHSNNASLIGINKHIRHLSINILKKNQKRLERERERESDGMRCVVCSTVCCIWLEKVALAEERLSTARMDSCTHVIRDPYPKWKDKKIGEENADEKKESYKKRERASQTRIYKHILIFLVILKLEDEYR